MYERIKKDIIAAMKSGDEVKKNLLRTLAGDCAKENKSPDNDTCIATIKSFLKKANEAFTASVGKRDVVVIAQEMCILESYLPQQLEETELREAMKIFFENGSADMKNLMADLKLNFKDRYDGKLASTIAKELING